MLCQHIPEIFYGGAGGGGKSEWLLMEALQYVDVPGYSALLLRRTYQDFVLPGSLMYRAHDWLGRTDAHWSEQNHAWTFPTSGGGRSTLQFGYLEHEDDKRRYRSAEFHYVGIDELTDFTETQVQFLFTRQRRRVGSTVPIRLRTASNPGGPGHEWVKLRYILPGSCDGIERLFIPAYLTDNPFIDQEAYISTLEKSSLEDRHQILYGDWDYTPAGNKFKREWLAGHLLQQRPALKRMLRYWDVASREEGKGRNPDWTRGCLMGLGAHNELVVCHMAGLRSSPGDVEDYIRVTAEMDAQVYGKGMPIFMEQEPGSSGVNTIDHYHRHVLAGFTFYGNRSTGSKEERFNPFSAYAQAGNVYAVMGPWVPAWLQELEAFPNPRVKDDQVDATSGAMEMLFSKYAGRPAVRRL